MYRTVMVPLDGSAFGEHALPLALTIAQRSGAAVHLVHVAVPPTHHDLVHLLHPEEEQSPQVRGQHYLEQLVERLVPRWKVPLSTTVLDGPVGPALERHALVSGAELVVMTTHGRGSLKRVALGSVADQMVRTLPLPVLLMRPREETLDLWEHPAEEPFHRILIPLDGSELAESVLEPLLALGMLFEAEYTLLQAIYPPMLGYALTAHPELVDQQVIANLCNEARTYLDMVAERLRKRHLKVQTDTALGYPPRAILEYAHGHEVKLIGLATHGQGGVSRLLLGSTADEVVRGASMPVLVCRPPAAIVPYHERAESRLTGVERS
jgi:nucleotide-binding universal stress UspA family protein